MIRQVSPSVWQEQPVFTCPHVNRLKAKRPLGTFTSRSIETQALRQSLLNKAPQLNMSVLMTPEWLYQPPRVLSAVSPPRLRRERLCFP